MCLFIFISLIKMLRKLIEIVFIISKKFIVKKFVGLSINDFLLTHRRDCFDFKSTYSLIANKINVVARSNSRNKKEY